MGTGGGGSTINISVLDFSNVPTPILEIGNMKIEFAEGIV
jgi:hypothetical protein